jgi:hypothetical protein
MKTTTNITKRICCAVVAGFLALGTSSYAGSWGYFLNTFITSEADVPGRVFIIDRSKSNPARVAKIGHDNESAALSYPQIHRGFHVMTAGDVGKAHAVGSYVLVDKNGEEARLAVLK